VGVEKLAFRLKWPKFGGQEMSCDWRRSLITHPDAISFLRILGERVFQQPRLLSPKTTQMVSGGIYQRLTAPVAARQ
jgi:hypothetical protein